MAVEERHFIVRHVCVHFIWTFSVLIAYCQFSPLVRVHASLKILALFLVHAVINVVPVLEFNNRLLKPFFQFFATFFFVGLLSSVFI